MDTLREKNSCFSPFKRKMLYKQALRHLRVDYKNFGETGGICGYLYLVCELKFKEINATNFPELFRYKPHRKNSRRMWWDKKNFKKREEILKNCMDETVGTDK